MVHHGAACTGTWQSASEPGVTDWTEPTPGGIDEHAHLTVGEPHCPRSLFGCAMEGGGQGAHVELNDVGVGGVD